MGRSLLRLAGETPQKTKTFSALSHASEIHRISNEIGDGQGGTLASLISGAGALALDDVQAAGRKIPSG